MSRYGPTDGGGRFRSDPLHPEAMIRSLSRDYPWGMKILASALVAALAHLMLRRGRKGGDRGAGSKSARDVGRALDDGWAERGDGHSAPRFRLVKEAEAAKTDGGKAAGASPGPLIAEVADRVEVPAPEAHRSKKESEGSEPTPKKLKPRILDTFSPPRPEREKRPKMRSTAAHPGLSAFHAWHAAISDLYRSYTVGKTDGSTPALPIIPKSERGKVRVCLEVTNATSQPLDVFWVDYLGREEYKGTAAPGGAWHQIAWIGHPWTFRTKGGLIMLHFVPFRVIPTFDAVVTVNARREAVQRFSVMPPSHSSRGNGYVCDIIDPVFPHPSARLSSPERAFLWSRRQMEREGSDPQTLLKYLRNALKEPDEPKYRQIRTANKTFFNGVWITAGRGMMHSLGFEENGAYVEMGPPEGGLPRERLEQMSAAVAELEAMVEAAEQKGGIRAHQQPRGADGYGRAGFGRVGMS